MKIQEFSGFSGLLPRFSSPFFLFCVGIPLGEMEGRESQEGPKEFFSRKKEGRKTVLLIRSRAREC